MNNTPFFIAAQTEVVPIAWGEPGTGKTRGIEAYAQTLGYYCESISLSQHEPTDIGGYPKPINTEGKEGDINLNCVRFLQPEFIYNCTIQKRPSILFLDELTTCSPATQAAALRLMTHGLPNTKIICAANPPACAANGYPLEPPMNNRLFHWDWEASPKEWATDLMLNFPAKSYPQLPKDWRDFIPRAAALVSAYARHNSGAIQKMPKVTDDKSNYGAGCAWPSFRSWTNASILMGAALSLGHEFEKRISKVQMDLLRGCVGEESSAFCDWRKAMDLPDPEDILDKVKKGKLKKSDFPDRADKVMVMLSSVIGVGVTKPNKEKLDLVWGTMEKGFDYGYKDLVVAVKDPLVECCKTVKVAGKDYNYPEGILNKMAEIFDIVTRLKK